MRVLHLSQEKPKLICMSDMSVYCSECAIVPDPLGPRPHILYFMNLLGLPDKIKNSQI